MVEKEEIRREMEGRLAGAVLVILDRMECLGKDGSVRGWLKRILGWMECDMVEWVWSSLFIECEAPLWLIKHMAQKRIQGSSNLICLPFEEHPKLLQSDLSPLWRGSKAPPSGNCNQPGVYFDGLTDWAQLNQLLHLSSPSWSSDSHLSNHILFGPIQVQTKKLRPKWIANSVCTFLHHFAYFPIQSHHCNLRPNELNNKPK